MTPPPCKCVLSQGLTQFLPASRKSYTEWDKEVPKPQHVATNKASLLENGVSEVFAANAAMMWSMGKNNE